MIETIEIKIMQNLKFEYNPPINKIPLLIIIYSLFQLSTVESL